MLPEKNIDRCFEELQQGLNAEENARWIYREFSPWLTHLLRHSGFSQDEIPDLLQEIFFQVFRGIRYSRNISTPQAWMRRIAQNAVKMARRSRMAQRRAGTEIPLDRTLSSEFSGAHEPVLPAATPTPEDEAILQERRELLNRELHSLPARMRECTLLTLAGFSYKEIAAIMGVKISTVGVLLKNAKDRLRRVLKSNDEKSWEAVDVDNHQ